MSRDERPTSPWPARAILEIGVAAWIPVVAGAFLLGIFLLAAASTVEVRSSLSVAALGVLAAGHVGIATGVATLLALALGSVSLPGRLRAGKWRRRPLVAAAIVWLIVAYPCYLVGGTLIAGEWIARQSGAGALRFVPVVVVGGGIALATWACQRFPAAGEQRDALAWRRIGITGLLLAAAGVVALADSRLMPGRFSEFHFMMYLLSALTSVLGVARLVTAGRSRLAPAARVPFAAVGALLLAGSLATVATADERTRAQIVQHSPVADTVLNNLGIAGRGETLAAVLTSLDPNEGRLGGAAELPRGLLPAKAANGKPWNVAFVVVDTLRADALPPVRRPGEPHASEGDTPNLDRWIAGTFRFSRAYAQASATHRSIPPMFRSLHAYETSSELGVPLSRYAASLGLRPAAVVNEYFIEPRVAVTNELLDGFEITSIYENLRAEDLVAQTGVVLDQLGDDPFFLWIHYFNMHAPGYAGRQLGDEDGTPAERYRLALAWLDEQFPKLLAEFDGAGVSENTIVFLLSDHGEALGERGGSGHGGTVFENELRVPLFVYVPGREGKVVDDLVSNVDVLPTMVDLLGEPADPLHRGRSLVPLMAGSAVDWSRPYYFENGKDGAKENIIGVVDGSDKLAYKRQQRLFFRYDVDADPDEQVDLFDRDGVKERRLQMELMRVNPAPFAEELEKPEVVGLLHARLAEADATAPGEALPWLIDLAVLEGSAESFAALERLFAGTGDHRLRAMIAQRISEADADRGRKLILARLRELAGTPEELALVRELRRYGMPSFDSAYTGERLRWWAREGEAEEWIPWLELVSTWRRLDADDLAPGLGAMLAKLDAGTSSADERQAAWLIAQDVGLMRVRDRDRGHHAELARRLEPFFDGPDPQLAVAAGHALSVVGSEDSLAAVERNLSSPNPRVRQAALNALARIRGKDAVERIIELGGADGYLTMDSVNLLEELRDVRAVPYLQQLYESHHNRVIRERAGAAAEYVETGKGKLGGRKKKRPKGG